MTFIVLLRCMCWGLLDVKDVGYVIVGRLLPTLEPKLITPFIH